MKTTNTSLSTAALDVLQYVTVTRDGQQWQVGLPGKQLDRKLYVEVNTALEALGGKWNRKAKAHVFDQDPVDTLEDILVNRGFTDEKWKYQFFQTPDSVADLMVRRLDPVPGSTVLEPSAGHGRIVAALRRLNIALDIVAVELDPEKVKVLRGFHYDVFQFDFLKTNLDSFHHEDRLGFDAVAMNPPFTGQQDIDHVRHGFNLLKPGGRLVAIMSAGTRFRSNKKAIDFRELIQNNGGTIEDLPENSFESEGTKVRTVLVTVTKGV